MTKLPGLLGSIAREEDRNRSVWLSVFRVVVRIVFVVSLCDDQKPNDSDCSKSDPASQCDVGDHAAFSHSNMSR